MIKYQGYCLPKGRSSSTAKDSHERDYKEVLRLNNFSVSIMLEQPVMKREANLKGMSFGNLLSHTVRGPVVFKKPQTDTKSLSHVVLRFTTRVKAERFHTPSCKGKNQSAPNETKSAV